MLDTTACFEAGESITDITPGLGVELSGFSIPVGKDRKTTAVRQPAFARALVLRLGSERLAIVSLDVTSVSSEWAAAVQQQASHASGISASNIRLCATHTHSMPGFRFVRRCGEVSAEYMRDVQAKVTRAICLACDDLSPTELYLGRARVVDGSYNRTAATWKTEEQFDEYATCDNRWLDRTLHALWFQRGKGKRDLLWYHFSAHPACNNDTIAWPSWPGLVVEKLSARRGLRPSFLQGHCGDIHAGNGEPRLGDPDRVSDAVTEAIDKALSRAEPVEVATLVSRRMAVELPLDVARFQEDLRTYGENPAECCSGEQWLDEAFAADWARSAAKWDLCQSALPTTLSAVRLGNVGILFHGAELYSYYGLAIRHGSPFPDTLVVGCTDDMVGYLADPKAFKNREYSVTLAPRSLDQPPFAPLAATKLLQQAVRLLKLTLSRVIIHGPETRKVEPSGNRLTRAGDGLAHP